MLWCWVVLLRCSVLLGGCQGCGIQGYRGMSIKLVTTCTRETCKQQLPDATCGSCWSLASVLLNAPFLEHLMQTILCANKSRNHCAQPAKQHWTCSAWHRGCSPAATLLSRAWTMKFFWYLDSLSASRDRTLLNSRVLVSQQTCITYAPTYGLECLDLPVYGWAAATATTSAQPTKANNLLKELSTSAFLDYN